MRIDHLQGRQGYLRLEFRLYCLRLPFISRLLSRSPELDSLSNFWGPFHSSIAIFVIAVSHTDSLPFSFIHRRRIFQRRQHLFCHIPQ